MNNVVAILSMADMACLACVQKLWSAGSVWYVAWSISYVVKFYCC